MRGTEIRSRPGRLLLPALVIVLGLLVPVAEFAHSEKVTRFPLALSTAILIMGLYGLTAREPWVRFRLEDDGLVLSGGKKTIPYSSLIGLTRPPRVALTRGKLQFPIDLYHAKGVFRIPSCINVSSKALFDHLTRVMKPTDSSPLDGDLGTYQEAVLKKFGPKKVHVYRKMGPIPTIPWQWARILWGLFPGVAVAMGGLSFFAADSEWLAFLGWSLFGALCTVLPYLFRGLARLYRRFRPLPVDVLIVNPLGIALRQGGLLGKLKWRDIEDVIWPAEGRFVRRETWFGVKILVPGAFFVIQAVYDQPIQTILRQIITFWKPRELSYLQEDPEEEVDEEELEEALELA